MSQLKKCFIILIFLFIGMTSYIVFAKAGQKSLRAEIESPYKWGKGMGPIQVRIEEKEKHGDTLTLEGQISTKLAAVNIRWKLPPGVSLVSGQANELVEQDEENSIISRSITVKIDHALTEDSHIVFFVTTENEVHQRGNTAVYNLSESPEQKEKLQSIRTLMKSRSVKPVR
jgi:hypothetical protein